MSDIIAYSIKDAVRVTGIGRTTLYELIKAGEVAVIKIGVRTLVRRSEIEALLDRYSQAA